MLCESCLKETWVVVKELKLLSYRNSDDILLTICPYYGNLNQVPEQQARNTLQLFNLVLNKDLCSREPLQGPALPFPAPNTGRNTDSKAVSAND